LQKKIKLTRKKILGNTSIFYVFLKEKNILAYSFLSFNFYFKSDDYCFLSLVNIAFTEFYLL